MTRTNILTCGETIVDDDGRHNELKITFSHRIWCWAHNFWPPSVNNFVKSWLDCVMVCLSLPAKTMVHFKKCAWMAVTPRTAQRLKGSAKLAVFPCVQPIICACVCTTKRSCIVYAIHFVGDHVVKMNSTWKWIYTSLSAVVSKLKSTCFQTQHTPTRPFCYSICSHMTRAHLSSAGGQLDFLPTSINVTNGRFSLLGQWTVSSGHLLYCVVPYRKKGSDNLASTSYGWEN